MKKRRWVEGGRMGTRIEHALSLLVFLAWTGRHGAVALLGTSG